jgi:hypothetical protein
MGLIGRAGQQPGVYTAPHSRRRVCSAERPAAGRSLPAHAGCRSGNTLAGLMRMIRASAGAAELGSVRPPASACGPGVAVEPTPLPARRGPSPCCRSRPRAHQAPARASAPRRPAPPRCYRPDMALETLPFRSAGSRRRRHPPRTDTGTAPRNAVSQGFCASETGLARRRPCVKSRVFGHLALPSSDRVCTPTPARAGNLWSLAADDRYDFVTGSSASTGIRRCARRR